MEKVFVVTQYEHNGSIVFSTMDKAQRFVENMNKSQNEHNFYIEEKEVN